MLLHTLSRIFNGFRMIWATLLVFLRYPAMILLVAAIGQIESLIKPNLVDATALFTVSPATYAVKLFIAHVIVLFIVIALMKYLTARLDKLQYLYRPFYRSYAFFVDTAKNNLIVLLLWALIVTGIFMAVALTTGTLHTVVLITGALIAAAGFFVPALIAEGRLSLHQFIPESTRIFIKYWPEIVGFLTISKAITFLLYSLLVRFYPDARYNELDLFFVFLPEIGLLNTFIRPTAMKVILLRADRGQHVGEDFAPDLPGSKA